MKTLLIRFISALAGLFIFVIGIYNFGVNGIRFFCFIAAVLGAREYNRLFFEKHPQFLQLLFQISSVLIFILISSAASLTALAAIVCVTLFFCVAIWSSRHFADLKSLLDYQIQAALGLFYVGTLPALASLILNHKAGLIWFYSFLAIVFVGDTMAYLIGWSAGKNLLLPAISPKKTIEGAVGGLLGSVAIAAFCHRWIENVPLFEFLVFSFFVGLVAQVGDLFESLLKRVANRKDSGTLMPGHGGILDRLDGILFASPLFYLGVLYFESYL